MLSQIVCYLKLIKNFNVGTREGKITDSTDSIFSQIYSNYYIFTKKT